MWCTSYLRLHADCSLQRLSWAGVKQTFKGWQLWIFTVTYAFWSWATNSNTWIILFLVSHPPITIMYVRALYRRRILTLALQKDVKNPDGTLRFNVSEINAIPIGGYALQLISMLFFAWLSSRTGKRATWIVVQMVSHIPINVNPVRHAW